MALITHFRQLRDEQADLMKEATAIARRERTQRRKNPVPDSDTTRRSSQRKAAAQASSPLTAREEHSRSTPMRREDAISEQPLRRKIFDPKWDIPSSPTSYVRDVRSEGERDSGGEDEVLSVFFAEDYSAPILSTLSWPSSQRFNILDHISMLSERIDIKPSDVIDVFDPIRRSWDSATIKAWNWEPVVRGVPLIWRFRDVLVGKSLEVYAEDFRSKLQDIFTPSLASSSRAKQTTSSCAGPSGSKVLAALNALEQPVASSSRQGVKRGREYNMQDGGAQKRQKGSVASQSASGDVIVISSDSE